MSKAQFYENSRTRVAFFLRLFIGLCGFVFLVARASAENNPADDFSLPADHGYILVRITMNDRLNIPNRDRIVFSNYDTGESFSVQPKTPHTAGVNAWLSLISTTKGRYYFSRYRSFQGSGQTPIAKTEVSDDDIFEVKSGVINYIGDWDLKKFMSEFGSAGQSMGNSRLRDWQRLARLDVAYDLATIEKARAHFPEHFEKQEVFLSFKGKQAISLNDFIMDVLKQHSDSAVD